MMQVDAVELLLKNGVDAKFAPKRVHGGSKYPRPLPIFT
jgi:hypothetical protein